jgi:ribulose-phosphate 3-epimerase
MSKKIIVAPSVLAADFGNLKSEINSVIRAGADWIHIDVMDGSFVPPITFGGDRVCSVVRSIDNTFCDVHLMINNPQNHFETLKKSGANLITVHQEVCPHMHRTLQEIKSLGIKAGVAINPGTPVETIYEILELADLILVMTVNPGWGGQKFIPTTLSKIKKLSDHIKNKNLNTIIQVDGGVDKDTAIECIKHGATSLVAGSYIFNSPDRTAAINSLRLG